MSLQLIRGGQPADDHHGRRPPHNLEAEEAVLGAMLVDARAVAVALPLLKPNDLYRPAHANILEAAREVAEAGHVDAVTIAEHLERTGLLEASGGRQALAHLMVVACPQSVVAQHAEIIARHATARRLISLAGDLSESSYDGLDPAVIVAKLKDDVDELIGATNRRNRLFNASDQLDDHLDVIAARAAGDQDRATGIRTKWHDLDELIGGLRPGQLVVIAGRPGMGKSAVAAGIALRTAVTANLRVLTVSVEMSLEELLDRYVAATARVDLTKVRSGQLTDNDWGRVNEAAIKLAERNLWVLDDPNATLPAIHAAAQRIEADLVIVDYLQLVKSLDGAKNRTREREVAELSGGLKRMARDLGVPVVALSQFNRDVDNRLSDKRPQLTDLRESGAIENDSDAVIGLFRDDYYNPDSNDKGVLEMIVLKQRNGPTGVARLFFESHTGRVANLRRF